MAGNPVFDPENVLGSGLGKLTTDELLKLVKRLCELSVAQCGDTGFRGGFRPGNINVNADEVVVGPADKAGEDGWTKDELEYMAPEVFWNGKKTASADVYSIGLILYVGLNCGNVPFVPMADYKPTPEIRANALRKRMNGEKIVIPNSVDAPLAMIVSKAIAFEENARYASPLEMLNALRSYCGEAPVTEIEKLPPTVIKNAQPPVEEKKPEPAPVKVETPAEKPQPAPKAEPVKAEEPPKAELPPQKVRRSDNRPTRYEKKMRKTKIVTLSLIFVLLCATAVAGENPEAMQKAYTGIKSSVSAMIESLEAKPTPEPTAEPTPEPTESGAPEITPSPEPTPTPAQSICEVIVEDISWDKAELKCREMGGHLVTITSKADYERVCELLEGTSAKYVWIGCYRNDAGIFTWTSGAESDYYNWASGEPSEIDTYDGTSEDYIMLVRQPDGTWLYNDNRMDPIADYAKYYSGKIAYICEH